jgi:hypothetical protein
LNVGYDTRQWVNNVSRIQTPAEASLPDYQIGK